MRNPHSARLSEAVSASGDQEVTATLERRSSGRFRVIFYFGPHPVTGMPLRWFRTFNTEREAIIFRDAMLQQPQRLLARFRDQLQIEALPPFPDFPEQRTFRIRGQQVMMDADAAQLFGTRTGLLNQAVSRNRLRFPDDFAFRLTSDEVARLRQIGAVKPTGHGGRRNFPRVFTELGLLMVAAILKSPRAVRLTQDVVRTINAASHALEPAVPTENE